MTTTSPLSSLSPFTSSSSSKVSSIPLPGSQLNSPRKMTGGGTSSGLKRPQGSDGKEGLKSPRSSTITESVRPPSGRTGTTNGVKEENGKVGSKGQQQQPGMLQKIKMIPRPGLGKRTSSSSGFSSARSTLSR